MTENIYSWSEINESSHSSGYTTEEVDLVTPTCVRVIFDLDDCGTEEYFYEVSGSRLEIIAGALGSSHSGEVDLARYAAEIICGDGSWLCGSDDGSKLGLDGFNVEFSIGISKDEEEEFLALLDSDYVDAIRSPGSEPYRRRQEEIARWQAENQE